MTIKHERNREKVLRTAAAIQRGERPEQPL